ncbi:hypothetical protein [Orenia marismortui]|uniref:Uncharacterized protein n=1 Tax=Orenia marismortui TaxID=46469 RepID=A0A4R8H0Y5_9FIRM|nr:hypothetical protein [Orenia marismortui]TDX51615.1 hypothetical protein C7959_11111 [Orenia marismortui]
MRVSVTNPQINYYQQSVSHDSKLNNIKDTIEGKLKTSKAEDNRIANPSIWKELSQEYDITNLSFNNFEKVCNKLLDAKQISLLEHGILTGIPKIVAKEQKYLKYKVNPLLTSNNQTINWEEKKLNWIEELNTKAEQQKKFGNISGYNNYKKFTTLFKNII